MTSDSESSLDEEVIVFEHSCLEAKTSEVINKINTKIHSEENAIDSVDNLASSFIKQCTLDTTIKTMEEYVDLLEVDDETHLAADETSLHTNSDQTPEKNSCSECKDVTQLKANCCVDLKTMIKKQASDIKSKCQEIKE